MDVSVEAIISSNLDTASDTSACALMKGNWYYLVESIGDLLLVTKPSTFTVDQPVVRRVNMETKVFEQVRSIGSCALFVSHDKCLSIDANKFPSIQGGCIYFVDSILTRGYDGALGMTIFHVADNVINFDWGWGYPKRLHLSIHPYPGLHRLLQVRPLF